MSLCVQSPIQTMLFIVDAKICLVRRLFAFFNLSNENVKQRFDTIKMEKKVVTIQLNKECKELYLHV